MKQQIGRVKRVVGGAALLAALASGLAACSDSQDSAASNSGCGFKLAFFGGLSGSQSAIPIADDNGAKLAIDQYNKANESCTVQLVPFDSQGSPDQAPQLAQQAIDDEKILGIVGPIYSGESEAADPLFAEAGLPSVTPVATRPSLSRQGWKTFFRAIGNDTSQGPAAAEYIKTVLKTTKIFVIDDQSAYGAGLSDEVKKSLGAAVIGTDKVQGEGKQTDFSATVTKVKSSGAAAIFYGGYYQEAGLIRKQLTAVGVTAPMIGGDGMKDPAFVKIAGQAAAEGTVMTCPCQPSTAAKGTFAADYKTAYGSEPGTYSDVTYDVTNILLNGIKAGKTTRADLLSFVKSYNQPGVAATYKFTDTGELDPTQVKIWTYKVHAGQIDADREITKP